MAHLESVVARIVSAQTESTYAHVINRSLLISSDNAHAVHPNYPQKHDDVHLPKLNGGPQKPMLNNATQLIVRRQFI